MADCGDPPPVENGDFNTTGTIFQSVAEYGCDEGFTLSGSQNRTCPADGTWSGAAPVCIFRTDSGGNTQSEDSGPIIAGVVVGVVVVALIALLILFAIIFVRRRRRHGGMNIKASSNGNTFADLNNPVYSGGELTF